MCVYGAVANHLENHLFGECVRVYVLRVINACDVISLAHVTICRAAACGRCSLCVCVCVSATLFRWSDFV